MLGNEGTREARALRVSPLPHRSCVLVLLSCLAGVMPAGQPVLAAERVAVMVLGVEDSLEDLADQCSEVLVAAVSRRSGSEIVGKEEFLARLSLEARAEVDRCLQEKTCLAKAVTMLGLESMILGYLGRDEPVYRMQLLKVGADGEVISQVKQEFPGGPARLLPGISPMLDELLKVREATLRVESRPAGAQVYIDDRPQGTTPLVLTLPLGTCSLRVEAPGFEPHRQVIELGAPGQTVEVALKAPGKQHRAQETPGGQAGDAGQGSRVLAWSLAAGATLALTGGGVLHALAWRDAQLYADSTDAAEAEELKERGEYRWTAARFAYGAGLALAAGAAVAYYWAGSHRAGEPPAGRDAAGIDWLALAPATEGTLLLLGGSF